MFNIPTVTVAKTTLTGTSSSVTLTYVAPSVAWTPRHLVVRVNGKTDRTGNSRDEVNVKFNGDTGTNYNYQALYGYASSSEAARYSGVAGLNVGWIATDNTASTVFGSLEAMVPDALSTRTHKSVVAFVGAAEDGIVASAGRWASTVAITSVTMSPVTGTNFKAGSTFELCVVDESFNINEQIKGSAGTFTVSSIGGANGDLVVIGNLRSSRPTYSEDNAEFQFNGDTTVSNYNIQVLTGLSGTTVAAYSANAPWYVFSRVPTSASPANVFGAGVALIPNFSDGSNDRVITALAGHHSNTGTSGSAVGITSTRWNNTAAITSVLVEPSDSSNWLTGSMLSTYAVPKNLIGRQELSGTVTSVTFADIPQTYDHLELSVYARTDRSSTEDTVKVEFNGDTTAANYDQQVLLGADSGVTAAQSAASSSGIIVSANSATANIFGSATVTIYNYTKTDRHKHWLGVSNKGANDVRIASQRWENTAAITSIVLDPANGTNFLAGSVFELRGIHADIAPAAGGASDIAELNGIAPADIEAVN
tara:strand:- start:1940 stop:3544 length:1605 start_codon:yes stop_codon:yes gene_type:complete